MLEKAHPEQIEPRLVKIQSSGYFLPAESWQAALSTGALAHMSTEEVQRYSGVFYSIRVYVDLQKQGYVAENQAKAFVMSRPVLTGADVSEAAERIILFAEVERGMLQVCEGMDDDINRMLAAAPGASIAAGR